MSMSMKDEESSSPTSSTVDGESHADLDHPKAVEAVEKEAEKYKLIGNNLFKDHHFEEAAKAYGKAIEVSQIYSDQMSCLHLYYCNRAFCHIKLENFGSAIMDAEKAIELNPSYSKGFYRRGCAYVALNKFNLALKDFQIAYKLKSDYDTQQKIKECQKEIRSQKFAAAISSEKTEPLSKTIDVSFFEADLGHYKGPRYSRNPSFLTELIDYIKVPGNVIHKRDAVQIVLDMIECLQKCPNVVNIEVENNEQFTVCGDVHGQFYDLLNIFEINGKPSEDNPYLFNGDFVDRGSFSVECILTLFTAKLIYPASVHLARGNHETRNMNKLYGFQGEVVSKYNQTLYELFCECFCWLPLAHTINDVVFVVHGGLFAKDGITITNINSLNRNTEPPDEGIMTELLWSDPQPQNGRSPSKRGVACAFGPDVTNEFLKTNNLKYIIRSHEMKPLGYDEEHNGKLVTVFSAPNYCDQMGNKGAFIRLTGPDLKPKYITFDAVSHPSVKPMQYASPIFSLL